METMEGISERVQRGVAFMDENADNDWYMHCGTLLFDMADGYRCLLAQYVQHVEGDDNLTYDDALSKFGISTSEGIRLGFNARSSYDIAFLTKEWRKVLAEKRGEEL